MTALRTVLAFNGPMPAYHAPAAITFRVPAVLKNMALFLASPFIGLAYAVLLPFVGFGMLLWVASEGVRKSHRTPAPCVEEPAAMEAPAVTALAATVPQETEASGLAGAALLALKLLAAPFAGLAFVVAMPFVALGALAFAGIKALASRAA